MPSPIRRSARGLPPTASSTTSSLSSRQEHGTRVLNSQKSATPRSLSSEEASEPPIARRSQRQPVQKEDTTSKEKEAADDIDEDGTEEEEITRCICGHQEYPGPPLSEAFADIPDAQSEDTGGLFILCDGCNVWQHGGCVGIVEESQSPDKYYCEECRPKQHTVHTDSRGQRYSLYLPLHPKAALRRSSMSRPDKEGKKEQETTASRGSVDPSTGKRRATMRSKEHDDEEEQLKRAIEESRREVEGSGGNVRRNGKRGRDGSEDGKSETKRQRRVSESLPSVTRTASLADDSGDTGTTIGKLKKAKAEAAHTARHTEQQEKDKERETARAEAAGRRQERAKSRRVNDTEPDEDSTPRPPSNKPSPPAPSSQPPSPPPSEKLATKRVPGKKPGKKLGNNQYTKKNYEQAVSSPHGRKRHLQTVPSGSGDDTSEAVAIGDANGSNTATGKTSPGATGSNDNGGNVKGKFGRGRKAMTNGNSVKALAPGEEIERTFTNMHAALQNMSAFVTKEQQELASTGVGGEKSPAASEIALLMTGGATQAPTFAASESSAGERKFEDLSAVEMAAQLQNNIEDWQRQWGHLAVA